MVRIRLAASLVGATLVVLLGLAACGSPAAPPSPGPTGGTTITVGVGDDLLAAVAGAPAGATLELADGTHTLSGTLLIDEDLTLTGSGPGNVSVAYDGGGSGDPTLSVHNAALTVRGITFRHSGNDPGDVGVASDATLDLGDCAFTGGTGGGTNGDGLALAGTTGGSIAGCSFFRNEGAGLRAIERAHPTVTLNQLSDNGTGLVYLDDAAGDVESNTAVTNTVGLTFEGRSTPTVTGNASQDNANCGLTLRDTAMPTLVDNAVTGNRYNLCDARTLSLPPLSATCTPGDSRLNPDPANDLVVQVLNASDMPQPDTRVDVMLLDPTGRNAHSLTATTDSAGVATLVDAATSYPPATGSYSAVLEASWGSQLSIVTACGDLTHPGTYLLRWNDPALEPLGVDVSAGSAAADLTRLSVGFPWGGKSILDQGNTLRDQVPARALPASYLLNVTLGTATDGYLLFLPMTVAGPTGLALDVTAQPTSEVVYTTRSASGDPGIGAPNFLYRQDPNVAESNSWYLDASRLHVTPGDYWGYSDLYLADGVGSDWRFMFGVRAAHFGPAGTSHQVSVGGALTASVATNKASYAPGDTVYLTPGVVDEAGHVLMHVYTYASTTTASTTTASTTTASTATVQRLTLQALRPEATDPIVRPQGFSGAGLNVTLLDPGGTVVATLTTDFTSVSLPLELTLPAAAPAGTYTATLWMDLGPYQSSRLTASTAFTVE